MNAIASITTSVDGYVTDPTTDRPASASAESRLHHWLMRGPWSHEEQPDPGGDRRGKEFLEDLTSHGAATCGRGMYEAAGAWVERPVRRHPLPVLTHRTEDALDPSRVRVRRRSDEAMQRATDRRRTARTSASAAGPT